jgi:ribosomal protein L17
MKFVVVGRVDSHGEKRAIPYDPLSLSSCPLNSIYPTNFTMRHGIAFRKLSRTSSHRMLMLRNLVSSLLEHEQIETTVAKAKEAARMAEWVITWGKKGTLSEKKRAESFLMVSPHSAIVLYIVLKCFQTESTNDGSKAFPGLVTSVHQ